VSSSQFRALCRGRGLAVHPRDHLEHAQSEDLLAEAGGVADRQQPVRQRRVVGAQRLRLRCPGSPAAGPAPTQNLTATRSSAVNRSDAPPARQCSTRNRNAHRHRRLRPYGGQLAATGTTAPTPIPPSRVHGVSPFVPPRHRRRIRRPLSRGVRASRRSTP
jgi:hypothetical protein